MPAKVNLLKTKTSDINDRRCAPQVIINEYGKRPNLWVIGYLNSRYVRFNNALELAGKALVKARHCLPTLTFITVGFHSTASDKTTYKLKPQLSNI